VAVSAKNVVVAIDLKTLETTIFGTARTRTAWLGPLRNKQLSSFD